MKLFCDDKGLLALPTIQFNMIELNMWRLINTSFKKDGTMVAYGFHTFPRANKLLMFSPRSISDRTLTFILVS